ncbi:MAG: Rrf2 family transcriptional regulator [Phycisphaerae bacterium]|jgi:Rrf2 family protein
MSLSQKCQYAVRAVLELSKFYGEGPVRIQHIAETQNIPQRFLENILNEMRSTGIVESRRGAKGGYLLKVDPAELSIGQVIRYIDGPLKQVACITSSTSEECELKDNCVLSDIWSQGQKALEEIYDNAMFDQLAAADTKLKETGVLNYCI